MKVFGDRSIKYKYLNPNTLFVALGNSPYMSAKVSGSTQGGSKASSAAKIPRHGSASAFTDHNDFEVLPSMTLILLDSATGRVLHSQEQLGASGPVRLLYTENLAVAEFWDAAAKR